MPYLYTGFGWGCVMSNDLFDFKNAMGLSADDITRSAKTGMQIARLGSGWALKRQLTKEGYDPITIDAAVAAVKEGRDPASIIEQAHQAYALRDKQDQIRKNPPHSRLRKVEQ